jgi:hypothetical protein
VAIANGRITALGPAAATPVPEGAVRIDGRGKYLMPGLAEMHGHVPPPTAPKDFVDDVLFLYVAWIVPTLVVWETLRGPVTLDSRTTITELRYMPVPPLSSGRSRCGTV